MVVRSSVLSVCVCGGGGGGGGRERGIVGDRELCCK